MRPLRSPPACAFLVLALCAAVLPRHSSSPVPDRTAGRLTLGQIAISPASRLTVPIGAEVVSGLYRSQPHAMRRWRS